MALCDTCGANTTRVISRWNEFGRLPDKCIECSPESFEKFTAPSDKKIWMGYEAHPEEYVKAEDGGYDRKPEYRSEQEQRLCEETEDERDARLLAESKKRATRRTKPMDVSERLAAIRKAEQIAAMIVESNQDVN